jgi:hypothetical protein
MPLFAACGTQAKLFNLKNTDIAVALPTRKVRDTSSPPEWSPYFLNYKVLKRCVKVLGKERAERERCSLPQGKIRAPEIRVVSGDSDEERITATDGAAAEKPLPPPADAPPPVAIFAVVAPPTVAAEAQAAHEEVAGAVPGAVLPAVAITSLPAERAFFQLLTAELGKAAGFYDDAERDMLARFGRVEEGKRAVRAAPLGVHQGGNKRLNLLDSFSGWVGGGGVGGGAKSDGV